MNTEKLLKLITLIVAIVLAAVIVYCQILLFKENLIVGLLSTLLCGFTLWVIIFFYVAIYNIIDQYYYEKKHKAPSMRVYSKDGMFSKKQIFKNNKWTDI